MLITEHILQSSAFQLKGAPHTNKVSIPQTDEGKWQLSAPITLDSCNANADSQPESITFQVKNNLSLIGNVYKLRY